MPHRNHFPDGASHPQLTSQSLEMITAATTAALNQHLSSIGFLPRVAATPSDESITNTASLPPAARDASPPRTLPPPPHLDAPTPGPVLPNPYSMNNVIHHLQDDRSPDSPSSHAQHRFSHDFVSKMQAEYRTLDTHRVPRVQPLQFSPHTDRTAATQLLVQSMRDALSRIFDIADPSGSVTMRSPSWVSGWHAPLRKQTKASTVTNRHDTHTLHRLVDDHFAQLQERLALGVDGPGAFKTLLTNAADHFDRRRGFSISPKIRRTLWDTLFELLTFFSSNGSLYRRQGRTTCALARYGNGAYTHSYGTTVSDVDADLIPGQISYAGKTL